MYGTSINVYYLHLLPLFYDTVIVVLFPIESLHGNSCLGYREG